jgi:hypothetical protein
MKNALRLDVDYRKNVAEMDRIFAVQDNSGTQIFHIHYSLSSISPKL